jgi:hypothetical protein
MQNCAPTGIHWLMSFWAIHFYHDFKLSHTDVSSTHKMPDLAQHKPKIIPLYNQPIKILERADDSGEVK